jgi:hypothetical protein
VFIRKRNRIDERDAADWKSNAVVTLQRAASRTAPHATSFNSGTKTLILRWTALQKNTERSKPMCHARLI